MKEKFKAIENELERLNKGDVHLLDLMIYDEITCQLEDDLSDEKFEMLWCKVYNAYLKSDDVSLFGIVKYCVNHIDEIEEMSSWDIINESYVCF